MRPPLMQISANIFALYICALFAGLTLQGAIDDYGLWQSSDAVLVRTVQDTTGEVCGALERLFWLTGERMGR